jgi:hypothetical protein
MENILDATGRKSVILKISIRFVSNNSKFQPILPAVSASENILTSLDSDKSA